MKSENAISQLVLAPSREADSLVMIHSPTLEASSEFLRLSWLTDNRFYCPKRLENNVLYPKRLAFVFWLPCRVNVKAILQQLWLSETTALKM